MQIILSNYLLDISINSKLVNFLIYTSWVVKNILLRLLSIIISSLLFLSLKIKFLKFLLIIYFNIVFKIDILLKVNFKIIFFNSSYNWFILQLILTLLNILIIQSMP